MTPFHTLVRRMGRFVGEVRGSAAVELVISLPLLLWALAATVVFFDGYKARYQTEMAAQTVADIMSRETDMFTAAYVEGLNGVFDFLADSRYPTRIRVSSVIWDSANNRNRLQWSYGTRGLQPLPATTFELMQSGDLDTLAALFGEDSSFSFTGAAAQMPVEDLPGRIPPVLPGEALLLVETFALWSPFASVGVGQLRFAPVVVVRPRFAPWIHFDGVETIYPESDYEIAWVGGGNETLPDPTDPVIPTPPSPNRTFSFDDGVTTGWSRTSVTSGGPTGGFLGPFGPETYAAPVTLAVDLLNAGTNATIAFDLLVTDSWDGYHATWAHAWGDNFTLYFNNQPISMDLFINDHTTPIYRNNRTASGYLDGMTYRLTMTLQTPPSGTNFAVSYWNDQRWRVVLTLENAPQTFSLGFSAGTNETVDNEGFGLDNLSIAASGTGSAAPFTNTRAAHSADPHTRFMRYTGCPEYRIPAPWLTMTANDLATGITMTRQAGGPTNLSGCSLISGAVGRINATPHLILNYDNQSQTRTLQVRMNDGNSGQTCDTTLLIRDPNGQWWFNDDFSGAGWNAGIRISSAVSGQYAIFIGTYGNAMCNSALTINRT